MADFCQKNGIDTSDCGDFSCPSEEKLYIKYLSKGNNWTKFRKYVADQKIKQNA